MSGTLIHVHWTVVHFNPLLNSQLLHPYKDKGYFFGKNSSTFWAGKGFIHRQTKPSGRWYMHQLGRHECRERHPPHGKGQGVKGVCAVSQVIFHERRGRGHMIHCQNGVHLLRLLLRLASLTQLRLASAPFEGRHVCLHGFKLKNAFL